MNNQELTAHEALLLGSKLIQPLRGSFGSEPMSAGCAMAMICDASGTERDVDVLSRRFKVMNLRTVMPCQCLSGTLPWPRGPVRASVTLCLVHLFDEHVCPPPEPDHRVTFSAIPGRRELWTIEQVAEWLRGLEAALPEEANSPTEKTGVEVPA